MQSTTLSDWLQVVGAAGIIASLIFVGMQLQQTQKIAIAAQYQARHESAVETFRAQLDNERVLRINGGAIVDAALAHPDIDEAAKEWIRQQPVEDVATYGLLSVINTKTADNLYFQYQSGLLADEAWRVFRLELKGLLSQSTPPGSIIRFDVEHHPELFRATFHEMLERLIAEIDSEAA